MILKADGFDGAILGLGFGVADYSGVVQVGSTGSANGTAWVSDSGVRGRAGAGVGAGLRVGVSVSRQVGSVTGVGSYDAPAAEPTTP